MIPLAGLALALPVLGEGPQVLSLQVVGTDQPVVAEWVGQGRLSLQNDANRWQGDFHTEPLRFLQLRLWEGEQSLWEGTVPLPDQRAEILSFRVIDQTPGRPRHAVRVAAAGPLPVVAGVEGEFFLAALWGLFVLAWLVGGLRIRARNAP